MTEHLNGLNKRKLLSSFVAAVLAVGLMVPVAAAYATPSSSSKEAEAQAALDNYKQMQNQLDEASNHYTEALMKQEEAQNKVQEAQAQIEQETQKIKGLQGQLGDRARDMYRNGSASFLDIILGATTFDEFANNLFMLDTINQNDAKLVQETKDSREKIESAKAEYVEQEKVATEEANKAREIKENAQALSSQAKDAYNNLSEEAKALKEQEEAAATEAARVAAETNNSNGYFGGNAGGGNNGGGTINNSGNNKPADDGTVVGRAWSWVGNAEYVWGACSPGAFDCSGFVSYCLTGSYSRLGTTYTFMGWPQVSNPQPGDVCVNSDHCGIYIGGGQMIHAATEGVGVIVGPVQGGMIFVRY